MIFFLIFKIDTQIHTQKYIFFFILNYISRNLSEIFKLQPKNLNLRVYLWVHMWCDESSKALSVNDGGSRLVVLGLGDPHGLKGGERGQDGAADPHGVLALGRRNDLDLHGAGRQRRDLLLHAVRDAREHGGAAGHDVVGVQVLAYVDVTLHDRAVDVVVQAGLLHAKERGLQEGNMFSCT